MKTKLLLAIFSFSFVPALNAENLRISCVPKRDREEPYRTFEISILNADTDEASSEIAYAVYPEKSAATPDSAGILSGFARGEVYTTQISSRFRQIRIEGGNMGLSWNRDVLQLRKRSGNRYEGLFNFPEGSDELDLGWHSNLSLECERVE